MSEKCHSRPHMQHDRRKQKDRLARRSFFNVDCFTSWLVLAHAHRGRMARQLDTLNGGDFCPIHLQDREILI